MRERWWLWSGGGSVLVRCCLGERRKSRCGAGATTFLLNRIRRAARVSILFLTSLRRRSFGVEASNQEQAAPRVCPGRTAATTGNPSGQESVGDGAAATVSCRVEKTSYVIDALGTSSILSVTITSETKFRTCHWLSHTAGVWWWIGFGLCLWVVVSVAAAVIVSRVISHADLEEEAVELRRDEHGKRRRGVFRR